MATEMNEHEARAAAEEALHKMKLSKDETDRLGKAFKDPKFMKMFQEYVDEIKDPKYREETEQYLREVEARGQAAELYGDNVQLITPEAGFVVKSRVHDKKLHDSNEEEQEEKSRVDDSRIGMKVFVNVCHNSKVGEAKSVKVKGGENWSVPYSLGAVREGKDKAGSPCEEYDFVINSGTYGRCCCDDGDPRLKGLVIDTALDAVDGRREDGLTLSREFSIPKMRYKGDTKQPSVQAWRSVPASAHRADETGTRQQQGREPATGHSLQTAPESAAGAAQPVPRSSFDLNFGEAEEKAMFAKQCRLERELSSLGHTCDAAMHEPVYDVVYRYTRNDLGDAWQDGDANKQLDDSDRRQPDVLVVKVNLPRLDSIARVALDVTSSHLSLSCEGVYRLRAPFPFQVDDAKGKAQFDKRLRQLVVTLPVLKRKVVKEFVEPTADCEVDCEDGRAIDARKLVQEVEVEDSTTGGQREEASPFADVPRDEVVFEHKVEGLQKPGRRPETDAERMWRELHEQVDSKAQESDENAATSSGADVSDSIGELAPRIGLHAYLNESDPQNTAVSSEAHGHDGPALGDEDNKNEDENNNEDEDDEEEEIVPVVVRKTVPKLTPRFQTSTALELD